jgi:hypothetical protein
MPDMDTQCRMLVNLELRSFGMVRYNCKTLPWSMQMASKKTIFAFG